MSRPAAPAARGVLTLLGLGLGLSLAATGCIVEQSGGAGFGQRATGTSGRSISGGSMTDTDRERTAFQRDAASVVTPAEAFSPLPPTADGRGPAARLVLSATPPRAGEVYAVDATVVVEISIRDAANDLAATPRFNLADMRAQSTGTFNGRTVGRLRGRLTVQRTDPAGRVLRAAFETSEAALVRDGALLARVPAARLIELSRTMRDEDGDGVGDRDEDGRTILSPLVVRTDGQALGPETVRLFRMCLFGPLESVGWDERVGTGRTRPRRAGEAWTITPGAIAEVLGLPADAAVRPRGVARVLPVTSGVRGSNAPVIEVRTRAESVIDERIIEAFGPALAGLPDAASVHRIRGTQIDRSAENATASPPASGSGSRSHVRSSIVAHRFDLVDGDGPLEGQRVERIDISITPVMRQARSGSGGGGMPDGLELDEGLE